MSILAVNFKHLYQRRNLWFWHLMILCQAPLALLPIYSVKGERCLGYLLISLLMGIMASSIQKEVLIKPFSFCLPGHRQIPRLFIFWIGGIVNLILGCMFLAYPGLDVPYVLLVVFAGGFAGMMVYFYGVYIGFLELLSPAGGIFPLLILGAILFKWDKVLQNIIISQPILVILAGGTVCVWVWRLLGRDFLARKYCGKLVMEMFDNWNYAKAEKYRQALADRNLTETRAKLFEKLQGFFLGRMGRYDFLSRGRYVWGNLYMVFGKCFGHWRMKNVFGGFVLLTFFLLFFGFAGDGKVRMINFLFFVPVISVLGLDMLPYRSLLFPAGRNEKYFAVLILAAVITFAVGLLIPVLAYASVFLETLLPEISFEGKTFHYYGMNIGRFYIYLLLMPIALICAAVFPRSKWFGIRITFAIVVMQGWMICEVACRQTLMEVIGPAGVAALIVLCWIGFLIVLRYICMKCNFW